MNRHPTLHRRQSGMVLVVSLLMLVVITVLALSAFEDSTVNLRIVSNTQFRQSAQSAAQAAIEKVLADPTNFQSRTPSARTETLNGWTVTVQPSYLGCPCGGSSGGGQSLSAQQHFNIRFGVRTACWDVAAGVTDPNTGTSVVLHQGIERKQSCPGA
jgi:type II secretory pathway component PulK